VREIIQAALADGIPPEEWAALPLPDSYRALTVHAAEADMFASIPPAERDPRAALHVEEVPRPEIGPGEVLVAVMASSINYNTVWSSIFHPVPTFEFLKRYGSRSPEARKHDLPYHVLGSDMAGIIVRTGDGVRRWKPGDAIVAHCLSVELEDPAGHNDAMLDPAQRVWGFETNFGGLGELALVKANQLMPKSAHLTWEEAAAPSLVNSTAYRQLVSRNGADMKQGDIVLIWGSCGGLGSHALQLALNGGAIPICVVSSPAKADICRGLGAELIIDRRKEDYRFWQDAHTPDRKEWRRLGTHIRELTNGKDPDIVFEHPGRETFAASVYVARRGGTVVTCASTSGYDHYFDNRYLWMNLKRIVGTHFANYDEAWRANELVRAGRIFPTVSVTHTLDEAPTAVRAVHQNTHVGKISVLCCSPAPGLGVTDPAFRKRCASKLDLFRSP
jgi:crotonyl-CoA reductase